MYSHHNDNQTFLGGGLLLDLGGLSPPNPQIALVGYITYKK